MLFASHPIARIEDFDALGPELAAALRLPAGTRKITRLILDGAPHKALAGELARRPASRDR